jgi:hypothetical protein
VVYAAKLRRPCKQTQLYCAAVHTKTLSSAIAQALVWIHSRGVFIHALKA